MSSIRILLILVFAYTQPLAAAPAPWFWWISKINGTRICQQTAPGEGWYRDKAAIPYDNARCIDHRLR